MVGKGWPKGTMPDKMKDKIRSSVRERWNEGVYDNRVYNNHRGWPKGKKRGNNPEHSKLMKSIMLKKWQDKEFKERMIKKLIPALLKRPTSLEVQMMEIIKKNNLPYKYTGDGSFLIGFKNPDFVNVNGQKICIEVANNVERHHPKNYEKQRTEYFLKYGWKCIIFRADRILDENEVLKRIYG